MMLGGRTSFGPAAGPSTELADILPVEIHPGDGQLEPEGGIKFVPQRHGLTSYFLQVGATTAETAKLWDMMPPILGTNRFGEPKEGSGDPGQTPGPAAEPLMVAMEGPGAGASSPTAARPGSGRGPPRRAGSPTASSGDRSSSGSPTRRTRATTRSS